MTTGAKLFLAAGGIAALLAVALGAFGAHALKGRVPPEMLAVWHTGVEYHLFHALGQLAVGIVAMQMPESPLLKYSGWLMLAGILLFSGSLRARARATLLARSRRSEGSRSSPRGRFSSPRWSRAEIRPGMVLAQLLAASERVGATRSRLSKITALADCLRTLDPAEIVVGVAYLSGDTRQGKIGIGYAGLKDALAAPPAGAHQLTLLQIDEELERLSRLKGQGSAAERARLLSDLFARASAPERDFLARLAARRNAPGRAENHAGRSRRPRTCRLRR
jgi:uncharacterized membrane protein YgdD (TMEM256/DUF423 family)